MGADSPSAGQSSPLPSLALMALAVGISVANPFYVQSLLPSVQAAFGLQGGRVLLGPMATQLGMAAGFLLLLPLGDGTERRRMLTLLAIGMALACGVVALGIWPNSLSALALGLMAVDLGVQGSFVANQARIYGIDPSARSRMSGQLFLTAYLGAAACSVVISMFWSSWHWPGTTAFALTLVTLAFVLERQGAGTPQN